MDAVLLHHRKLDRQSSESYFFPYSSSFHGNGLLHTPPFSFSYPSFSPALLNPHQNQPPLLPLPIPKPYQNHKRINNRITKHQSISVKKSNTSISNPKREKAKHESVMNSSVKRLGPEPKGVPKVLFSGKSNIVVGKETKESNIVVGKETREQVANKYSGSVVSNVLSPPPSSLPLPTFSLRPKLSCNAEAAVGIDAGATDNLRRILRLR